MMKGLDPPTNKLFKEGGKKGEREGRDERI